MEEADKRYKYIRNRLIKEYDEVSRAIGHADNISLIEEWKGVKQGIKFAIRVLDDAIVGDEVRALEMTKIIKGMNDSFRSEDDAGNAEEIWE